MRLARLRDRLALALPDRGMPIIVSCFDDGESHAGWETALARARRVNGMDEAVPSAVMLPTGGMGFFGWPAIQGHRGGQHFILHPGHWKIQEESDDLILTGNDRETEIEIQLSFRMLRGQNIILRMHSRVTNVGESPYCLDRCMAGSVLIEGGAQAVTALNGSWGREFHETRFEIGSGAWLQESRRGRTSHDKQPTATIHSATGKAYRLHLGWSGNHVIAIDRLDDGRSLAHAGELFDPGEVILPPGESYQSPTLYVVRDNDQSANELSAIYQQVARREVLKFHGDAMKPRPVILNTWEGTYFDHDVAKLKVQATTAKELGIERFVLDDGWFGRRDSDNAALGDWFIDERKYPKGLKPLIDHVTGLGMEFGIWIEPEMVNPDSDLFRAHPDWALQVKGKPLLLSRQQLALDLTNQDVFAYLWSRIDWLLGSHAVSYVKWDMNRDITHAGDLQGRAAVSRQTRAAYALIDKVREHHPHVEIESCASGGGRSDFGALSRTHRVWVSDCTDALERLEIQHGARNFLPPEVMGCHISASPNHQTMRRHTMSFRAIVAFFGHFGIELDPTTLSDDERAELKDWIALHKALRPLLHHSDGVAISERLADGRYLYGVKLQDYDAKSEHYIVAVAQGVHPLREQPEPLTLPIWWANETFTVTRLGPGPLPAPRSNAAQQVLLSGGRVSGHVIANHGLNIPQLYPESAILLEIKTVKD
jgi:alpha-galactosidase